MMHFGHNPNKRKAETLIEVIISIFVVALGSAAATSLVVSALQTNAVTRDSLIALNLATEGIEAMRNIRDSNWIKYAYDKENCWNMKADVHECKDEDVIDNGNYVLSLYLKTMKWTLTGPLMTGLNLSDPLSTSNPGYQLAYADANTEVNSDDTIAPDDDRDLYVAKSGTLPLAKFYRMINVAYPGTLAPPDPLTDQELTVTSLVQWKERGQVHEIRIVSKLANYQKVKVK